MIQLTLDNLENFTRGAAFLGTGGGGDPYIGKLMLKHQLEKGKKKILLFSKLNHHLNHIYQ